jgi:predicted RecA/RadA family phage recombinase
MAKEATLIQEGRVIDYTATADIVVGQVLPLVSFCGVALTNIANGDTGAVALEGVYEVAATTADAIAVGTPLFWDNTTNAATIDSDTGANISLGKAVTAKASATAGVVWVKIN